MPNWLAWGECVKNSVSHKISGDNAHPNRFVDMTQILQADGLQNYINTERRKFFPHLFETSFGSYDIEKP